MVSKLYRQMYANTGIATDSARVNRANNCARWLAKPCQRLFQGVPMPELQVPNGSSHPPTEPSAGGGGLFPLQEPALEERAGRLVKH